MTIGKKWILTLVLAGSTVGGALGGVLIGSANGNAAGAATTAISAWIEWLRDDLLPTATGDFRLGPELYAAKLRHSLLTGVTPTELEAMALAEYEIVRTEMARIARSIWAEWMGEAAPPEDDGQAVRAVLDAIAVDHPRAEELLDFCRAENERIEAYVAEHDLVGLADEPLQVVWTPGFLRAFGRDDAAGRDRLRRHVENDRKLLDQGVGQTAGPARGECQRRRARHRANRRREHDHHRRRRRLEAHPGRHLPNALKGQCLVLSRARSRPSKESILD